MFTISKLSFLSWVSTGLRKSGVGGLWDILWFSRALSCVISSNFFGIGIEKLSWSFLLKLLGLVKNWPSSSGSWLTWFASQACILYWSIDEGLGFWFKFILIFILFKLFCLWFPCNLFIFDPTVFGLSINCTLLSGPLLKSLLNFNLDTWVSSPSNNSEVLISSLIDSRHNELNCLKICDSFFLVTFEKSIDLYTSFILFVTISTTIDLLSLGSPCRLVLAIVSLYNLVMLSFDKKSLFLLIII